MLPSTIKHTFLCQTQIISAKKTFSASVMSAEKYTKEALGPNNVVTPSIRNRNPMNLEKMRIGKSNKFMTEDTIIDIQSWNNFWIKSIGSLSYRFCHVSGYKPSGFPADKGSRNYWNALTLSCGGKHTQATVTHWTGRTVCSASTKEWAIAKFLYSNTDVAAVTAVGKVLGMNKKLKFWSEKWSQIKYIPR